ncbi:RTA1-domain-containing protein [Pholiota conissans]|uniref:RTA1-domain-containing protein n=1 Tax=Pholiota conissans TaxID=109636 RepID=A0A9P6D1S6_9AGAR|nr:RTA1-domain-containing protein [Pholiota conissans]
MSNNNGTATDLTRTDTALYGYIPSEITAIIFLALFSISTLAHFGQAIKYRLWFLLFTTFFCGCLEVLGWASRLWSSISPLASTPFQIQITATIVAPTPLLAANFVIFGRIVRVLGQRYSRLRPRLYTIIFTCSDVASLVIQGLGGGVAASAKTLEGANGGANIMLGGITFQLIIIVIFSACAIEYYFRYNKDASKTAAFQMMGEDARSGVSEKEAPGKVTPKLKTMSYALVFTTLCLFIRGVYRIIELSGGWNGRILRTQIYFNVLDGMMVILTIYTTNFIHPGIYLPPPRSFNSPTPKSVSSV